MGKPATRATHGGKLWVPERLSWLRLASFRLPAGFIAEPYLAPSRRRNTHATCNRMYLLYHDFHDARQIPYPLVIAETFGRTTEIFGDPRNSSAA